MKSPSKVNGYAPEYVRIIHLAVALTLQHIMLKPDQQEDHADKNQQHDQHLYYYCKKRRDHDVLDKQLLWLVNFNQIH